jgi:hypothetical protein
VADIQLDRLVTKLILDSTGFNTGAKNATATGKNLEKDLGGAFNAVGLQGVASFLSVSGAIAGTIAFLKDAYQSTMDYGDAVRRLAQTAKITTEEASKVIQVAEDFKISADDLNLASKALAREGIALSVENLAMLSDEYIKIKDPAEAQLFLMQNFGARGGTAFVEIMLAGGEAIRGMSEAIAPNLVLTQEQVTQQRELQAAVEENTDAWDAMKVEIAGGMIPTFLALAQQMLPIIALLGQMVEFLNNPVLKMFLPGGMLFGASDILSGPGVVGGTSPNLTPQYYPPSTDKGERDVIPAAANGLDMIVPPGYANDSFPIFAQSGEHVQITPAGKSNTSGMTVIINNPIGTPSEQSLIEGMHIVSWLGAR